MIDGITSKSGTPLDLDADEIIVNIVELTEPRYLMRVVAYLDGQGASMAPQLVRGVVYRDGALVASGSPVLIQNGQQAAWVPLRFPGADGRPLKPGSYQYGVQGGLTNDGSRVIVADGETPAAEIFRLEPFTPAPPDLLPGLLPSPGLLPGPGVIPGAPETLDGPIAAYLETLEAVRIPVDVLDDDYLSTLPFPLAQRLFTQAAPLPRTVLLATAGWYGSAFDETQGSNAVVRSDGPLVDLVGERIQVKLAVANAARSVVVYVHDMAEFPVEIAEEDIVLSQRSFLQIGNWGDDDLQVQLEVMA